MIKTQFVKSDDALKKLQARSKQLIKDALMKEKIELSPVANVSQDMKPLIDGIQERLKALEDKARDGPVIATNLEKLTDEQLALLSDLMKEKGGTEEKLSQIAHIVNPDVKLLSESIPKLNCLRLQLMESFVKLYSEEFHTNWKSETVYNNQAFQKAVDDVITYRSNIRRFAQAEGSVPPPIVQPRESSESSCVVA